MYGYLQKGEMYKAKELVYDMKKYASENPSSRARAHYIMMKADYLSETGNWADSIAYDKVDLEKLNLMTKGVQVYTQGMSGYADKNANALSAAIKELTKMESKAETKMVLGAPKMCSGVSRNLQPPTVNEVNSIKVLSNEVNEVNSIKVLSNELKASLALLNKDEKTAEKWMQEATVLEEETTFSYGPPNIVKPSFEMYGEWLASQGRKKEAQVQFEKVLERAPKRRLAMKGLEAVK